MCCLLFLPAGPVGTMWTLSRGGVAGAAFVVRIDTGVVDSWGGVIGRRSIRLASRQGCLVVRLVVLSFLFLPAAYGYTRWQSVVSKNAAAAGGINVWGVLFGNKASEPGNHTMVACQRAFVRLASREDCLVV